MLGIITTAVCPWDLGGDGTNHYIQVQFKKKNFIGVKLICNVVLVLMA